MSIFSGKILKSGTLYLNFCMSAIVWSCVTAYLGVACVPRCGLLPYLWYGGHGTSLVHRASKHTAVSGQLALRVLDFPFEASDQIFQMPLSTKLQMHFQLSDMT